MGGREREEPERREKADCDVFSLSPRTGPHQNPQQLTPSLEERERDRRRGVTGDGREKNRSGPIWFFYIF